MTICPISQNVSWQLGYIIDTVHLQNLPVVWIKGKGALKKIGSVKINLIYHFRPLR